MIFSRIVFRKLSEDYQENRLKGPKTSPEAFPEYPEITNKPVRLECQPGIAFSGVLWRHFGGSLEEFRGKTYYGLTYEIL